MGSLTLYSRHRINPVVNWLGKLETKTKLAKHGNSLLSRRGGNFR